jgi:hypothetical protein
MNARVVAYVIWLGVCLLIPAALAAGARRRQGVKWKCFGTGVLVGLVLLASGCVVVRSYFPRLVALPWLGPSASMLLVGFYFGALVELGRYLGFLRFIQAEERNWDTAVVFGLGTGAASVAIGALDMLLACRQGSAVSMLLVTPITVMIINGWTLLCGIAVHVALAVLVLQVFRRGGLRWLWLAILADMLWHVGPDVLRFWMGPMQMQIGSQSTDVWFSSGDTVTIAAMGVLGLSALWIIDGLRERTKATAR